jgi:diketogulonate reductase-like aldo/keto reductase
MEFVAIETIVKPSRTMFHHNLIVTVPNVTVGFGTAALGNACYDVVRMALEAGFRRFDTAEADWWYDQKATGEALHDFWSSSSSSSSIATATTDTVNCHTEQLQISTKIPPWSLTNEADIRQHAANSRRELVGFCEDIVILDDTGDVLSVQPYPLDIYYIHAPRCWDGWHPRCKNPPSSLLPLREAWMAMEAIVGIDGSAQRIGLSNIWPQELLDILSFVKERDSESYPPPRKPDVVQAFADPLSPNHELRRVCQEHGIEFVSYSTLGTQHHHRQTEGGGLLKNPVLDSPIIQELSAKYSRSVAEVVLSWAMQRNMSVIPRSSRKQHINELANLLTGKPFLSDDDLALIDSMDESSRES